MPEVDPIEPTRLGEVVWLEPYPDALLVPEAQYETSETISLAFITALQLLPPRQRAVLVLRDVLGFHADEVADTLDTTLESVTSALKRARAAINRRLESEAAHEPPPAPNSPEEAALVERLTRAYETGDIDGLIALLTDDVWVAMPPVPLEYQGIELARRFHTAVTFRNGRTVAGGADEGQRSARVRGVPARPRRRSEPRRGFNHVHPRRRPRLRHHQVRDVGPSALRLAPNASIVGEAPGRDRLSPGRDFARAVLRHRARRTFSSQVVGSNPIVSTRTC